MKLKMGHYAVLKLSEEYGLNLSSTTTDGDGDIVNVMLEPSESASYIDNAQSFFEELTRRSNNPN
jgi:hypothetical protein